MLFQRAPRIWPLLLAAALLINGFPAGASSEADTEYASGLSDYKRRNYRSALKHFQTALDKGNGSAENYLHLAHCQCAIGERREAVRLYREIQKIFKGLPAEATAAACIKRVDPTNMYRDVIKLDSGGGSSGGQAHRGLVNRITVIAPTVVGHPPVSPDSVALIQTTVSRLPGYIYTILDEGNTTINIGPNIIDKWPDALNVSKPGMEQITLAQEGARCYGRDIYFWERLVTEPGSKEVGPPITQSRLRTEIYYQLAHALDDCLGVTTNPEYRRKWEKDKEDIPADKVGRLAYYLNPVNFAGAGEVAACCLSEEMGGSGTREASEYFTRCYEWIKNRLEEEKIKRSGLAKANPKKEAKKPVVTAYLGATVSGAKKKDKEDKDKGPVVVPYGTINKEEQEKKQVQSQIKDIFQEEGTLEMPDEVVVPYRRTLGDKLRVMAEINGRKAEVLIDTGAYMVTIGKDELVELGIKPPEGESRVIGYGAGGAHKGWDTELDISIGKIKRHLRVHVTEGRQFMLLGQPFLRGMNYRVDSAKNYITFTKIGVDLNKELPYGAVEVPFRMVKGNMIVVAKVNSVPIEMNFDTGAPGMLLSYQDACRCGVDVAHGVPTTVRGVGASAPARICYLSETELGSIRKGGLYAMVGPTTTNLIGQTFFGQMKYIVDNEKHVIRFSR